MKLRLDVRVELVVDEKAGTFEGTTDMKTCGVWGKRKTDIREWEPLLYATAADALTEQLRLRAEGKE